MEDLPERVKKGGYKDIHRRGAEGSVASIAEEDGGEFLVDDKARASRIAMRVRPILHSPVRKIDGGDIEWQGGSRVEVLLCVTGLHLGPCREGERPGRRYRTNFQELLEILKEPAPRHQIDDEVVGDQEQQLFAGSIHHIH